jgi:hypothetical protein
MDVSAREVSHRSRLRTRHSGLGIVVPAMAGSQKTLPTGEDPEGFIAAVPDDARREDARTLCRLLSEWTGEPPAMWGTRSSAFGRYDYRYESGHEGTAPLMGFSPRKANLVIYLVGGAEDRYPKLLERLGPHRWTRVKRRDDVDREGLRALVDRTVRVHRADRA